MYIYIYTTILSPTYMYESSMFVLPVHIILKMNLIVEKSNCDVLQTEGSMALFCTTLGIVIRSNCPLLFNMKKKRSSLAVSFLVKHPSFLPLLLLFIWWFKWLTVCGVIRPNRHSATSNIFSVVGDFIMKKRRDELGCQEILWKIKNANGIWCVFTFWLLFRHLVEGKPTWTPVTVHTHFRMRPTVFFMPIWISRWCKFIM